MPDPSELRPYLFKQAVTVFGSDTGMSSAYNTYFNAMKSERPYKCPKCGGQGRYQESKDTGNSEDTDLIRCTLPQCDGFGFTEEQMRVKLTGVEYEAVP